MDLPHSYLIVYNPPVTPPEHPIGGPILDAFLHYFSVLYSKSGQSMSTCLSPVVLFMFIYLSLHLQVITYTFLLKKPYSLSNITIINLLYMLTLKPFTLPIGQFDLAAEHFEAFYNLANPKLGWMTDEGQNLRSVACEHLRRLYTAIAQSSHVDDQAAQQEAIEYLQKAFEMAKESKLLFVFVKKVCSCKSQFPSTFHR